jgi:hypothetical protein
MPNHLSIQAQRAVGPKYQLSNGFSEIDAVQSSSYFERNTTTPANSTLQDGTPTTANILNGDVIYTVPLKKGARILGGTLAWEALGASVTLSVGTVSSPTAYLGATSAATAGSALLASTVALGLGSVVSADTTLIVTVGGANPTLGAKILGFIEYLKN